MNCKNCRHWFVNPNIVIPGEPTEGKCLVSEIKAQSNHFCNAWELSQVAEWKDENARLKDYISKLEAPVPERNLQLAKASLRITELERRITEAKEILEDEMGEWLPLQVPYLPEGMMPIRKALDVLEGEEEEVTKGQGLPKNFPPVMGSGDGLGWY